MTKTKQTQGSSDFNFKKICFAFFAPQHRPSNKAGKFKRPLL